MTVKISAKEKIRILNSEDAFKIMQQVLLRENKIGRSQEFFWVIGLNRHSRILYIELVSLGAGNMVIVEPAAVFRVGVLKNTMQVILVHNHPGGALHPSKEDIKFTDHMIQVGKNVLIEVLDHIIITEKKYFSFREDGLMSELEKSLEHVPRYKQEEMLREQFESGIKEEKNAIARKALAKRLDEKYIAELTGLSLKQIRSLKKKKARS